MRQDTYQSKCCFGRAHGIEYLSHALGQQDHQYKWIWQLGSMAGHHTSKITAMTPALGMGYEHWEQSRWTASICRIQLTSRKACNTQNWNIDSHFPRYNGQAELHTCLQYQSRSQDDGQSAIQRFGPYYLPGGSQEWRRLAITRIKDPGRQIRYLIFQDPRQSGEIIQNAEAGMKMVVTGN